jgi:hypothetical protein
VRMTLGEVTNSSPASAAASKIPKLDTGFTMAAESAVGLGVLGIDDVGMDSSMGLLGTGGTGCAIGDATAAVLPTALFMCRLKCPTCPPPMFNTKKMYPEDFQLYFREPR